MPQQIAKLPVRDVMLWLKHRGLDAVMEAIAPKDVKEYYAFSEALARARIDNERQREARKVLLSVKTCLLSVHSEGSRDGSLRADDGRVDR
jgi:hypothetical protein